MMHCRQCEDRINLLLDSRIDPIADKEVVAHLNSCSACTDVLSAWLQIDSALSRTAPLTDANQRTTPAPNFLAPNSLPGRSQEAVEAIQANRPAPQYQRTATWLALAAAISWMVFTTDYSQPLNDTATPLPSPRPALVEATTADFTFENMDLRVNEPKWWGEMAAATLRPVQPLAEGLRPLTSSFQSAIQILAPKGTSRSDQSEATSDDLQNDFPDDFSAQRASTLQRTA